MHRGLHLQSIVAFTPSDQRVLPLAQAKVVIDNQQRWDEQLHPLSWKEVIKKLDVLLQR